MEDTTKKERTPDSVRSSSSRRGPAGSYDTSSLSSALEKLWIERAEASALDFKHDSILEAVVRFVLKCLVDATRVQFFSTNGFSQIQVGQRTANSAKRWPLDRLLLPKAATVEVRPRRACPEFSGGRSNFICRQPVRGAKDTGPCDSQRYL